jgi:hypothetical protein
VETSEKRRGRFAGLLSISAGTKVARDLREIDSNARESEEQTILASLYKTGSEISI